jgi:hypothetical protein
MNRIFMLLLIAVGVAAGLVTWASPVTPPGGVMPTLLARGTYEPFKVKDDVGLGFQAKTREPVDLVVRRHDYVPHSATGWHTHPGPVFITVTQGTLTFYEYDDPTCTPTIVTAPGTYVDTGHGHIGRNETGEPAQDMTVIVAPVGAAFRGELDAPGPYCGF